jgi:hypothetical protein
VKMESNARHVWGIEATKLQTADTRSRSRDRFRPSFAWSDGPLDPRGCREGRVPAGTRGPLREWSAKETAQQHTGVANHSAFPAQWLDGLCRALPGAEFLLASLVLAKVADTAPVDASAASAKA